MNIPKKKEKTTKTIPKKKITTKKLKTTKKKKEKKKKIQVKKQVSLEDLDNTFRKMKIEKNLTFEEIRDFLKKKG